MALPVASTSRLSLSVTCRACQRRCAASSAGKTVGKTAQTKSSKAPGYDHSRISPVAQGFVPAELHPGYPFVRNVAYTGADRPPIKYSANGHLDLDGKSMYRFIRDRAREEMGHSPPTPAKWVEWFSRNGRKRLFAGSIIQVEVYNSASRTSSSRFSGMLLGSRRARGATTFTLRNVIHKTGVEQTFILGSPAIKDISIILKANSSKARTTTTGKPIYPRWPHNRMSQMDTREGAYTERINLALRILQQKAQAAGQTLSKRTSI